MSDSTQSEPQKDPELLRLEAEKAKAAAAADIAASRLKQLQSLLPSSAQALSGNSTIAGDDIIECRILGMRSLAAVAGEIAEDVSNFVSKTSPGVHGPDIPEQNGQNRDGQNGENTHGQMSAPETAVFLHNEHDIAALTMLRAFDAQLTLIERGLDKEIRLAERALRAAESEATPAGESLGVAGVGTALKAAADLVSLFRIDIDIKYKTWTMTDATVTAAVAQALARRDIRLRNHTLMPVGALSPRSELLDRITDVLSKRADVESVLADLAHGVMETKTQAARLNEEISKAAATTPPTPAHDKQTALGAAEARVSALERAIARLQPAGAAFDTFQAALVKADPGTPEAPLAKLMRGEALKNAGDHVWLALKAVAAGGGHKTKRFLWWPTTKVFYSGGAIVEYLLFDSDGKVLTAGVVSDYSGFIEIKEKGDIPALPRSSESCRR